MSDAPVLTIGQIAQRAGMRTSHIRFYEKVGVLPEPDRVSGQRRYTEDILHRLSIIDIAQRAGLTLDEIRVLTGQHSAGTDAGAHIRTLADEKLPNIDALIARAEAVKHWLETARNCGCSSANRCGLFSDPTLVPPADGIELDIRQVRPRA